MRLTLMPFSATLAPVSAERTSFLAFKSVAHAASTKFTGDP